MRLLCSILIFLSTFSVFSQAKKQEQITRVLFVFDASRSMVSNHGNLSRMEGAKKLFYKFIDSLAVYKNMQFALRMLRYRQTASAGQLQRF